MNANQKKQASKDEEEQLEQVPVEEAPEPPEQEPEDDERIADEESEVPEWVVLPPDLKIPSGRVVAFLRFKAEWTDTPTKGDRQCIVWNLSDADERLALKRANLNDGLSAISDLAKQSIRAVDGVRVDWSKGKGPGSIDQFWREIGAKCRALLQRWYLQNHQLNDAEQKDFFESCVAVRTMG